MEQVRVTPNCIIHHVISDGTSKCVLERKKVPGEAGTSVSRSRAPRKYAATDSSQDLLDVSDPVTNFLGPHLKSRYPIYTFLIGLNIEPGLESTDGT